MEEIETQNMLAQAREILGDPIHTGV